MNIDQFIKQAKQVKLSADEKTSIRKSLLSFISNNPVRPDIRLRLSFWSNLFNQKLNYVSTVAILLILTVLVGGGVAVGAEKALPGDVLYPIKVGINEEVLGWLTASDEAKANWEIRRTERRLEEAEELAGEGSLNAEASENIEANFEAHAQRVKDRVEKFRNKENFDAAASVSLNFETALKVHEKILSKLAQKKGNIEVQTKPIRARIRSEVRESVKERRRIDIEIKDSAEGSVNTNDEEDGIESETDIKGGVNSDGGSIKTEGRMNIELGL